MQQFALMVLVALAVAFAVFAIPIYFRFLSYCERVAKATGREVESREFSSDENESNAFEREQYRKLRTGEYAEFSDPILVAQGRALAIRIRLSWWLALGLVAVVGVVVLWPK